MNQKTDNTPPQSRIDPVIAEEKLQGEHTPFGTNFKAVADNIKSWRLDALRDGLCCFTVAMYLHESIDVENALRAAASEKQAHLCPKCGTEMKSAGEIVSANLMQALREQHRKDEALRVCQHLWPHADKPMPAKWDCACGTRVYRSREDAIDD